MSNWYEKELVRLKLAREILEQVEEELRTSNNKYLKELREKK